MQYHHLLATIAALAAHAHAQSEDDPSDISPEDAELLSVVSVLQTALPSSLIQEALTNSAGVSSDLASEFAAGQTPDWFTALPSDVQSYLIPGGVLPSVTASATATADASSSGSLTLLTGTSETGTASSGSAMDSTASSTASSSRSRTTAEASATASETTTSSEAGAVPTAVYGFGVAGIAGFLGLLAL